MNSTDPQVMQYLLDGKYLLALGVIIVAVAQAAKLGLGAVFPWFKTRLGGYVVGFGTSALIYFGTALQQSAAITWQLVSTCIVMAFAASGKYEMVGDVVATMKTRARMRRIARAAAESPSGGILKIARPILVPVRQTFSVFTLAALIVGTSLLPVIVMPSSGCTPAQRTAAGSAAKDTGISCGEQAFMGLIGPAINALEGSDPSGDLTKLEKPGIADAVACAVKVIVAVYDALEQHTTQTAMTAHVSPRAHAAAVQYLATKKFKE